MKRMTTCIIALCFLLLCTSNITFASQHISKETILNNNQEQELSQDQIRALEQQQVNAQLALKISQDRSNGITPFGPPPGLTYETVYGSPKYPTSTGWAGGQPPGGFCLPSGGSIYIQNSGGPTISINVVFPSPFSNYSLTTTVGSKSNTVTGIVCDIPATNYYYKVWVTKTFKVTPYTVYEVYNGKKTIYHQGHTTLLQKTKAEPKRV